MALDAGSVFTTLGARLDKSAFVEFDAANKRAAASAEAAEARISAASRRMGASVPTGALRRAIDDTNLWSRVNSQASARLETLGRAAKVTAAVGLIAFAAAGAVAVKSAISFNAEMLKIHTQAGASTAEVRRMSAAVLELSGRVPQSPKELAQGLYHIESAGYRGAQALRMLDASARAAAIGGARLEDTTQAMIATVASHIKGVKSEADAMGQLNAIVGTGDMRMEGLAQAWQTGLLPSAHDAGLALIDVGAAMATVTDNATPANVTATRLRMTIALMEAPSKAAARELASIGMSSTQMAHDMRQPNGLLKAVEDLKTHLEASGKSAEQQDAILTKVFGGGRSSAIIHTLLSEIDRLRSKYDELGRADGVKQLDQAWAAFQHSSAAQLGELRSGAQAFAIVVGNILLPQLGKLAQEGSKALTAFERGGGEQAVGHALSAGFATAGQVISDVVPIVRDLANALLSVGQALDIGSASHLEAILAAIVGFQAVEFVVPPLLAFGGALTTLAQAAMTAPNMEGLLADIVSMSNPIGLVAAGVGALAAALVLLGGNERSEAEAAKAVTAAKQAEASAIQAVNDAVLSAADSTFAAGHADDALRQAKQHLADVAARYGKNSKEYAAALNAEHEAALRDTAAHEQLKRAKEQIAAADQRAQDAARKTIDQARQLLNQRLNDAARQFFNPAAPGSRAQFDAATIRAWQDYNAAVQSVARGSAAAMLSEMQLNRVLNGQPLLTDRAAQSVAALSKVWDSLSRSKQRALSLEPQNDLARIGALAAQLPKSETINILTKADTAREQIAGLTAAIHGIPQQTIIDILTSAEPERVKVEALKAAIAGMPARTVTQILSSAASEQVKVEAFTAAVRGVPTKAITTVLADGALSAQGQVAALAAAIGALPSSKTVTLTTVTNNIVNTVRTIAGAITGHASGRPAGAREAALVGEGANPREYVIDRRTGRGFITRGPMLVGLSDDDYVIPTEQRYAGRAIGLFASLARDLGIPGFARGRPPKHAKPRRGKHHQIPGKLDPLSLPVADIQTKVDQTQQAYDKAHNLTISLPPQIRDIERRSTRTAAERANKADDLGRAQAKLRRAQADERAARTALVNLRRELAEAKAYQAKIDKQTDLANLAAQQMTIADNNGDETGFEKARHDRETALRKLQALIAGAQKHVNPNSPYWRQLQQQINQSIIDQQDTASQQPQNAGQEFTDAERQQLDRLNADVALAALTPDTADDQAAQQRLVDFFQGVLAEVQADPTHRGGYQAITDLAQQLKTAQDNLSSLASTPASADLQAQLAQANARVADAQAQAQIAQQALAVFGGSGDIGSGGPNARAAAAGVVIHQTNNMLHPADPAVMRTIGEASVAGIGFQGGRRSPRGTILG